MVAVLRSTLRLVTTDFALLQPLQHKWKQTDGESETTDATSSLHRVKLHSRFQGFIEYNLRLSLDLTPKTETRPTMGKLLYLRSGLVFAASALLGVTPADGFSPTATRSQLLAELQRCLTPTDLLDRVGARVSRSIDPDGSLASLVLVRLSKLVISLDNQDRAFVADESSTKTLNAIIESLLDSDPSSNCESIVEATKACSTFSRISPYSPNSTYERLFNFWNDSSDIVSQLEPHHTSGVKWAFDVLTLQSSAPSPTALDQAYADLNLPFAIIPGCLAGLESLSVDRLTSQVHFRVDDIRTTSNKVVSERRQTAWEGDTGVAPFTYSGKAMPRSDWSPLVVQVRDVVQARTNQYYNGCLLNLYPDGCSGMRYHIDPDQGTLWDYDTAVVSVGASRRFAFRAMSSSTLQPHNFVVMHGDLTYMFGECQSQFQHTVKKADDKTETTPRASLVFKRTWECKK